MRYVLALATLALLLGAAAPAGAQTAEQLAGRWEGALEAGGGRLPLVLHFAVEGGVLTASLDSPTQGARGLLGEPTLTGSQLTVRVPSVNGTYTATVQGDTLDGTWSQGQALPLVFHRVAAGPPAPDTAGIEGAWGGVLDVGPRTLRIIVHFTPTAAGYAATLDSPDQGAFGIPGEVTRSGDSLRVAVPAVGGVLALQLADDRSALVGTLTQGGQTFPPVTLTRDGALVEAPRRPQDPQPPFPYTEEAVSFESAPGVVLSGTITRPPGPGPFSAVALVSGSGPQDRDESLLGHRPFAVLADHLSRHGILVLRYDDRGVGQSTGSFVTATSGDFAVDAAAAARHLGARPDVGAVGLVGHSEGGLVAPLAAGSEDKIRFVVLLAGPSVRGDMLLSHQNRLILQAAGMSAEGAAAYEPRMAAALARLDAYPLDGPLPDSMAAWLQADFAAAAAAMTPADRAVYGPTDEPAASETLAALARELTGSWMRYFFQYDPQPALRALRVPALALFGEHDLQVPPGQNEGPMREALAASGVAGSEVRVMPGLNHLFQTTATGNPAEYATIEETMSPAVLEAVATWIRSRTAGD